ncbi:PilN domain-containing protein [Pseudomonas sp. S32]|uniref:PilN domain-containing protein n=1 Tax=Pseudomonas sp. S32 TaxID=2767448 RepID=UPI0019129E3E|nr:PilN domain-containing protein [Pseudomonas sp. S32]MBK5004845.1 fimbrial protein [Pseudomonas sp. S32]
MIRLNLLPWRERQRQAASRRFYGQLLASAVLALCAVMVVDQMARQRGEQQRLSNLQREVAISSRRQQAHALAELREQHAVLAARLAELEGLRGHPDVLAGLFADLEGALPGEMQLLGLHMQAGHVRLTGVAPSGAVIAQFMRDLQRSGVLADLELKSIKSLPGVDEFVLTARAAAFWS